MLSARSFYKALDGKLVDSNGKFSVCKPCVQDIYDIIYKETRSIEKTIHRMCTIFNIGFTNEAMDATKSHIQTMLNKGKNVKAIFSIYVMKIIATKKSMDKGGKNDFQYEDVGVIFTEKEIDVTEIPISQNILEFWGTEWSREEIEYLETQYANFKQTHKADTYAEIVLLKEVCYTMLNIRSLRMAGDGTSEGVKELQALMKSLAVSPNVARSRSGTGEKDSFGLWIQDIEKQEPAQWLKTDPRGDMYRDVGNVEEYFQRYIVRPLKNFILSSRDFNVEDESIEDELFDEEDLEKLSYFNEQEELEEVEGE
jgi:hypothetical protein